MPNRTGAAVAPGQRAAARRTLAAVFVSATVLIVTVVVNALLAGSISPLAEYGLALLGLAVIAFSSIGIVSGLHRMLDAMKETSIRALIGAALMAVLVALSSVGLMIPGISFGRLVLISFGAMVLWLGRPIQHRPGSGT